MVSRNIRNPAKPFPYYFERLKITFSLYFAITNFFIHPASYPFFRQLLKLRLGQGCDNFPPIVLAVKLEGKVSTSPRSHFLRGKDFNFSLFRGCQGE